MASSIKFLAHRRKPDAVSRRLAVAQILGVEVSEVPIPADYTIGDSLLSQLLSGSAVISSAALPLPRHNDGITDAKKAAMKAQVLNDLSALAGDHADTNGHAGPRLVCETS